MTTPHRRRRTDPTEPVRRELLAEINSEPGTREGLEAKYGEVWSPDEVRRDFELIGFIAPLVAARRLSDGRLGSLMFQHDPRFYFSFSPHEE